MPLRSRRPVLIRLSEKPERCIPWQIPRLTPCLIDFGVRRRRYWKADATKSTGSATRKHSRQQTRGGRSDTSKKKDTGLAQILIIDDDIMVIEFLVDALNRAGHEVTTATDGWDGLKRFRPHVHELVITDICMPQVDGSDLLRVLRREVPGIPVLVITAHESITRGNQTAVTADLVSELGANRLLTKPFSVDALLAAVGECLRHD
jgi:two-component system response regulator GlrR